MEVTKQHLAAVLGGLVGGYMSDDDGLGTAMGIGVGATVGYHWKFVDPPKGEYISYKKKVNTNFDIPLTRVEEDVKRFREQLDKGNYIDYLEPRAKNKALPAVVPGVCVPSHSLRSFGSLGCALAPTRVSYCHLFSPSVLPSLLASNARRAPWFRFRVLP